MMVDHMTVPNKSWNLAFNTHDYSQHSAVVETNTMELVVSLNDYYSGVKKFDMQTLYYIQNGKTLFPTHGFMHSMDIIGVRPDALLIVFFNVYQQVLGENNLLDFSNKIGAHVPYKINNMRYESGNISKMHKMFESISELQNKCGDMISENVKTFLNENAMQMLNAEVNFDKEKQWDIFWTTLEFLYFECSLPMVISYLSSNIDCITYLFKMRDEEDPMNFIFCRFIEKGNSFLREAEKYNSDNLKGNALKCKRKFPKELRTLFKLEEGFLNGDPKEMEAYDELKNFATTGSFQCFKDAFPSNIIPFANFPETGIVARLLISLYVLSVSKNEIISVDAKIKLKREIPSIAKNLIAAFFDLKTVIFSIGLPVGNVLEKSTLITISKCVENSMLKIQEALVIPSITDIVHSIINTHGNIVS